MTDSNYGCIYKFTFPNGKVYIGLTKNLNDRMNRHRYSANNEKDEKKYNLPIYCAMRCYGVDKIIKSVEIIDQADTKEKLTELEVKYIEQYKSNINKYKNPEYGYNCTDGGEGGTTGHKHTEEYKQRKSKQLKQMHKDNPQLAKNQSDRMNENLKNNPNFTLEKRSERMKDVWKNNRENMFDLAKALEEDPAMRERGTKKRLERINNEPEFKERMYKWRAKNIDVWNLKTKEYIGNYTNIYLISEDIKKRFDVEFTNGKIEMVLSGERRHSKGFYFRDRKEGQETHPELDEEIVNNYIRYNSDKMYGVNAFKLNPITKTAEYIKTYPTYIECINDFKKKFGLTITSSRIGHIINSDNTRNFVDNFTFEKGGINNRMINEKKLKKIFRRLKPRFECRKIDGTFINEFETQKEAQEFLKKEFNIENIDITNVLRKHRGQSSSKGFIFNYIN